MPIIRDDLSSKLVHLVRGETTDEALKKFQNILRERMLRGGTGFIRGGFRCVCFTETPISKLGLLLAAPEIASLRYKPLGLMVDKKWVYEQGGRPVIYQPEGDYEQLHENMKYRHVRFEPNRNREEGGPVDLTWEREWRIRTDSLALPVEKTTVIVPNRDWRDVLIEEHTDYQKELIREVGEAAANLIEPYPWNVIVLEDLGIPIPDGI